MNTLTTIRSGIVAATIAALLTPLPASAQLSAQAVSCRATVAKEYGKLLKTAMKTVAGCHKSRNKNKDGSLLLTDCNDIGAADLKGKFVKSADKASLKVNEACTGLAQLLTAANVGGGKEYYISCPVMPCTGVSGVIDSITEFSACLGCAAGGIAGETGAATLGSPNPVDLDKDEQKCHAAIAKGYSKYLSTSHKSETSCQGTQDGLGDNTLTTCVGSDPKGKVAKSLTKASEGLVKKCTTPVTDLDGCSAVDLPSLTACTAAAWEAAADDAFTTTYEMEATGCPTSIRTTIRGGCSTQGTTSNADGCSLGAETGTVLSVGWKGLAHGVDITDNYTVAVDVTCSGTEKGSCGTCTSTGISDDNPQSSFFTRCVDDPWTVCDEPFQNDSVCNNGMGGACAYYLGPPLNVSAGGTPTCTLNIINSDIIGGTGDPDLGTVDFEIDLRALVHLGLGQTRPCAYCRNDPTPQDGVAGGTCFGGPRNNMPCDVQGFDLTFANPDGVDNPNSGTSLDCPLASGANISGSGLAIILPLTTGTSTKDAEDPCESPNASLDCFCGACSVDTTVSCNNDTECANLGLGSCGAGNPPGVDRKPNNCSDGNCFDIGATDRGGCLGTPDVDLFCSGALFANGKGIISCGVDADCDTYETGSPNPDSWVCPFDECGTCTSDSLRSCFLDPIELTGTPDPENPILVGTFCLPPSSNGSVNNSAGSPGPGAVQTDALIELRY
ncbi:MAG: hypothetical protein ABR538_16225 [Candidatus Binatia bacterium]